MRTADTQNRTTTVWTAAAVALRRRCFTALAMIAALATLGLMAPQTQADIIVVANDADPANGWVLNGVNALILGPPFNINLQDTVSKNGNFSPSVNSGNEQFAFLTLDTTTLTGILNTELGALGASQYYKINSATFSVGSAANDYQMGGAGSVSVHAMTTAFNVDGATWNDADTGVTPWAAGAAGTVSSADWNATVITTGVNDGSGNFATFSGLGSTLQGWLAGGSNLGLAFVESAVNSGSQSNSNVYSLTLDAEIDQVPEPSTLALATLGLLSLGMIGRRRRHR